MTIIWDYYIICKPFYCNKNKHLTKILMLINCQVFIVTLKAMFQYIGMLVVLSIVRARWYASLFVGIFM